VTLIIAGVDDEEGESEVEEGEVNRIEEAVAGEAKLVLSAALEEEKLGGEIAKVVKRGLLEEVDRAVV
jgi:hypothetical protein